MFGGLHVSPENNESDQFTLAEWNREAMIWEACSKIKFFKEFLKHKFLARWRRNSKYSRFLKLKKSVSKNILQTIPQYQDALLLVSKLVQEINEIVFLPKDRQINHYTNLKEKQLKLENTTLKILNNFKQKQQIIKDTFTLEKYLHTMYDLNKKSHQLLKYFFVYVKYVLDHTRARLYDKARFYEKLINADGPM